MESAKELQAKKDALLQQLKEVDEKFKTLQETQYYKEGLFKHDIINEPKPYALIIASDVYFKAYNTEIYRCDSETEMIDRLHEIIDSAHAMINHIQKINGIEATDTPPNDGADEFWCSDETIIAEHPHPLV